MSFLLSTNWFTNLFIGTGVAHSIFLVALTIAVGLLLAKIKIAGVSLGVTFISLQGLFLARWVCEYTLRYYSFSKSLG